MKIRRCRYTGRTIPSFRIALAQEVAKWKQFRYYLPKTERYAFDQMTNEARLYVSASSAALRTSVFEGLAMSIVFHHFKELLAIDEELKLVGERCVDNEFRQ